MILFLTGMMGTGKSTVGRMLAEALGYDFIDLDEEIVKKTRKSIERIFIEDGETTFRELESQTAMELNPGSSAVIAVGGGFPLRESNRSWMERNGTVIWLRTSPELILERIRNEDRPLLKKPVQMNDIEKILNERIAVYGQAGMIVDTDGMNPQDIARLIASELK